MKTFGIVAGGVAALSVFAGGLPAAAQSYGHRYDRGYDRGYDRNDDNGDVIAGAVVGALVGGLAGAAIGDGSDRYVAGGALAGAALGAAAASDDDYDRGYRGYGDYGSTYSYSYGGQPNYQSDCGYWRDGRCWRNRGHWERDQGINSRDGYDRRERSVLRDDRRDWRSDRRDGRYGRRDDRSDRRWRNY